MKKLLLVGLLSVGFLPVVHARSWEFKDNPDRRPSWAFTYQQGSLSGIAQRTEVLNVFGFGLRDTYDTPTMIKNIMLQPSIRLPLNDDVTLEIMYTYNYQSFDSSNLLGTYKGELSGSTWGGTFRKYFSR